MNALLRAALLAGVAVVVAGCGDLYRRNELFSSAIKKPVSPTVSIAAVPVPETQAALDQGFDEQHAPARAARPTREASHAGPSRPVRTASAEPAIRSRSNAVSSAGASRVASRPAATAQPTVRPREPAAVAVATPPNAASSRQSGTPADDAVRATPGDQVLAGLLRVWNKVAVAQLSSKTLFGVWPEDFDGRQPTDNELAKRGVGDTR